MRYALLLALLLSACSASPELPESCGAVLLDPVAECGQLTTGLPLCGAPAEWLGLSREIWGAYESCEPGAVRVQVESIETSDEVGQAVAPACAVRVEPTATTPEVVLAHELGHLMGFGHEDDPCALMSPVAAGVECGAVTVAGCSYPLEANHDSVVH